MKSECIRKTMSRQNPRFLKTSLLIAALSVAAFSAEAGPTCPQFQDGDRVCLIGDSITDIGLYHSYLQLFYATRFPERKIAFFGAGHSGGNSVDCMRRLSWDILSNSPNVATVMFGMNDMMAGSQGNAATPEAADLAIARRVDEVQANYEKLLDALTKANVRLILLGPSICDDTAKLAKPVMPYQNLALTRWTERLRQIAEKRKSGFVDVGTLMNEVNTRIQVADPTATLTSGDRIHGKAIGNIVMAYSILKAQGIDPFVSQIAVDAKTGKPGQLFNCTVTGFEHRPNGISFTCQEKALPFVPSKEAAEGLKLIPFTKDLNQEMLTVANLPPGRYALQIDETSVGDYPSAELASGVNLALNSKTPQYRQSEVLCQVNEERHALLGNLRVLPQLRHGLYGEKVDPNDPAAVDQFLHAEFENRKPGDHYSHYLIGIYLSKVAGRQDELTRHYAELVAKMEQDRMPKAHRFSLSLIGMAQQ